MRSFIFALFLMLPFVAQAEELENMSLKYEGFYSRMKAGEMNVHLNQNPDGSYKYKAIVETSGLTKYVTKYWSVNHAEGKIVNDKLTPSLFETTFQPKKKPKQNIVVNYTDDGVAQEIATPAENRNRRPEVPETEKANIPDPISAVLIARERIKEIVDSGTTFPYDFEQPVFDGRRVFMAKGQIVGYRERSIKGKMQKLLLLHGQRVPQAGFHPKEVEKMKGTEPVFDIYLDSNYIPVLVEGKSSLGDGIILLAEKCLGTQCGV